ncbi:recombinase family protein [Pedobacter sp. KBW01]|uniref:recombinase family protein n=1 Tax=Pedobacter sp. KBW01 TaxID=2153364 RepID=UPI000F5A56FC|nr:recombinase family protein [Pedobacter sp. KBW01]
MRWAYEELSTGKWLIDQIWRAASEKGLKTGRKNFWQIIRNPIYCGRIPIAKYKEEEAHTAKGQHEAIISEGLFYKVMDVLNGRNKPKKTTICSPDMLPLRGFLICPECGSMLSGSASKGYNNYYHYYHCIAKCGVRYNAEKVNKLFIEELKKYTIDPVLHEAYAMILKQVYQYVSSEDNNELASVKKQLEDFNIRFSKARDKMLNDVILDFEYRKIKSDCEKNILILENRLINLSRGKENIIQLIGKATGLLKNLHETYLEADSAGKRRLISSIYPQKLTFDGTQHRTVRMNEAVRVLGT